MLAPHHEPFASDPRYRNSVQKCRDARDLSELARVVTGMSMEGITQDDRAVSPSCTAERNPIVILGKSPGATEVETGHPFSGPAGEMLRKAFEIAGEDMTRYHQTYSTRWRPRKNNTPTNTQLAISYPILAKEIELIAPRKIIVLGARCADTLLGKHPHMDETTEVETTWEGTPIVIIRNNGFILRHRQLLDEYAKTISRHGYSAER